MAFHLSDHKRPGLIIFSLILSFFVTAGFALPMKKTGSNHFLVPSQNKNQKRITWLSASLGIMHSASFLGLYELWYKENQSSRFYFFDSREWYNLDKAGHFTTSFHISRNANSLYRWAGLSSKHSMVAGSLVSIGFQTSFEILDGFSKGYGFSAMDALTNFAGTAFFAGQAKLWGEPKIVPKFSFQPSGLAQYRPNHLGKNIFQQIFKDYNGQTYWLSANIHGLLPSRSKFPKWVAVSFGYGANGMFDAKVSPDFYKQFEPGTFPIIRPSNEFIFSLDIDLHRIKTGILPLDYMLGFFGFLKFPAPGLVWNNHSGFYFSPIYF